MTCSASGQPVAVATSQGVYALAAYGSDGASTFGGTPDLCREMIPDATVCEQTNPARQPITETLACGGETSTTSAVVVACDSQRCAGEIYGACGSTYPDVDPTATYPSLGLPTNPLVMGVAYHSPEIASQDLGATQYEYTVSPAVAQHIVALGHTPLLDVQLILFNDQGLLKPTAAADLAAMIARYPTVFHAPGLMLEVYDEPFWNGGQVASGALLEQEIASIHAAVRILRAQLPQAKLGLTQAGIWPSYPTVANAFAQVAPDVDVLITDVYAFSFDPAEWSADFQAATQFALQQRAAHPGKSLLLVVQGFAPLGTSAGASPQAATMTAVQRQAFELYMTEMFGTAKSLYDAVMVWGWGFAMELNASVPGKNFPSDLKQFYQQQTTSYRTLAQPRVPETLVGPLQGTWSLVGSDTADKILFFSGPDNLNGYCHLSAAPGAASGQFAGSCWTWAGQTFGAQGTVTAQGQVNAMWTGLPGGQTARLQGLTNAVGATGTWAIP